MQRAIPVHIKELWTLGAALARRVARVVRIVGQHVENGRLAPSTKNPWLSRRAGQVVVSEPQVDHGRAGSGFAV